MQINDKKSIWAKASPLASHAILWIALARFLTPVGGGGGGGGGGTPLYELYGDVPLDRVWFLASLS